MNALVPFTERQRRLPLAGRIRSGIRVPKKGGGTRPSWIETFRFTAPARADLDILATLYGGPVEPWSEPKSEHRWQLITEASEIKVVLPPEPLGDGPSYEMWGGKGLARSCDGMTCELQVDGSDGPELVERPCLCRERNVKECKPKLRLSVILPDLPLRGVWRFDTSSDLAADEIPGMVELIMAAQNRGLTSAILRLERRQSQGGSHRYVVPALGVPLSLEGLLAGHLRVGSPSAPVALTEAGGMGLNKASPALPPASVDHDIIEAELVEDDPSPREKARLLRVARARAALEGLPAPQRYEDIG